MSSISLADLSYISRETLASTFTPAPPSSSSSTAPSSPARRTVPPTTAIIDVRDSDHIGGHIRGSTWIPSSTLDYRLPELLRTLRSKEVVVFHCALSQQRGPGAALRYLREKERVDGLAGVKGEEGEGKEGEGEGEGARVKEEGEGKKQKVYVLQGGFTMWQEKYGEDEELTEGYQRDIWAFGG